MPDHSIEFLTTDEVLELHDDPIATFGGTLGVRDQGLLESALAQPQATFGGQLLHTTIYEQAAAYLFRLAMNHPFLDGNKRTAYAVMTVFLRINGYRLNLSQEEKYSLVFRVVEDKFSKEKLAEYLSQVVVSK
jgi:death on curing protein